jgi:hypothetical protein
MAQPARLGQATALTLSWATDPDELEDDENVSLQLEFPRQSRLANCLSSATVIKVTSSKRGTTHLACKQAVESLTTLPQRPSPLPSLPPAPLPALPTTKRSARGCEAVKRWRCVRGLLPLASQCKCNLTLTVSRTQPSPLCVASCTSSFAPSHPPRRPQPRVVGSSTLSTVGVASVGRLHGTGVAILYRLPASVALGSHQNRRSRNRAQGIQNLKTLW